MTHPGIDQVLDAQLRAAGLEVADEIGRGGAGVVFRCRQVDLDRVVAVKVLTVDLERHPGRFVREQRAMGRLTGHPNIVAVLQVGETDSGYPFLVMPYLQHGSLHDRIRDTGALPVNEVLRLGVKVAGALESAHRLGVIHRDVKPANILLTDYGQPALTDFGVAQLSGGLYAADELPDATPAFAAPEVLTGDEPVAQSDVYGLAATLFAALTGHALFERQSGEGTVAQFIRIGSGPLPDPPGRCVPEDVGEVLQQALRRDLSERPSALAFGHALQRLQAQRGFGVDDMAVHGDDQAGQVVGASNGAPTARAAGRGPAAVVTPMVGRGDELASLQNLVATSRLVTVTGVGGVGKTMLANEAARDLARRFAAGAWTVELGALRDGALVANVVAAALGLRNQSGGPVIDVMVDFLAARQALLMLDNCEHLVDAVAELAHRLLRECPGLHILATSREVLGVEGESVYPLSPLRCPQPDADIALAELASCESVALFTQCARAAVPTFTVTDRNADVVARICAALDGLPLAIELAAARLRAMSLQQVADGLTDGYAVLKATRGNGPRRQQTMASCMQWSYNLCHRAEQRLWSQLSVFAGGFDVTAARHVCVLDEPSTDIVDLLSALVDKSILIREDDDDTVRFRQLETLRQYGRTCLPDQDEADLLAQRHAEWCRHLVQDAAQHWFGRDQIRWTQRLIAEMPNIRQALTFSIDNHPQTALQISAGLRPLWVTGFTLNEARRWLDLALTASSGEPSAERVEALCSAAELAVMCGDEAGARSAVQEATTIRFDSVNARLRGIEYFIALFDNDIARAQQCLHDAMEASPDAPEVRTACLCNMGFALVHAGDFTQAHACFDEALKLTHSHEESVWRAKALVCCGLVNIMRDEPRRAQDDLVRGLVLAQRTDDRYCVAQSLVMLGWIATSAGDARRGAELMAAASTVSRTAGAELIGSPELQRWHDDFIQQARNQLGKRAFDNAWRWGSSHTCAEAIDMALGQGRGVPAATTERIDDNTAAPTEWG